MLKRLLLTIALLWTVPALAVAPSTLLPNGNYTVTPNDVRLVTQVVFTAARTITLVSASVTNIGQGGQANGYATALEFFDAVNAVTATNTLTITPATGETINGSSSSIVISAAGAHFWLTPNSGTNWMMTATPPTAAGTPIVGGFTKRNVVTVTGTFTAQATTNFVVATCVGGGGGGGGAALTAAGNVAIGGAGGVPGYATKRITSGFSGVTATIGAAGTAGATGANAGGNGGNTTYAGLTANGGGGGPGGSAATPPFAIGGGTGGTASGGDINISGPNGNAFVPTTSVVASNVGSAASLLGSGAAIFATTTGGGGSGGSGFGAAGSGGINAASQAGTQAGGAGTAGVCIIDEYQ